MRQFDVYANPSQDAARFAPAVLVLSSDLLDLEAVMVAPLLNDIGRSATQVDVPVSLNDETLVVALLQMAAVHPRWLRHRLGTLLNHEYDIRRGLERLFTGF